MRNGAVSSPLPPSLLFSWYKLNIRLFLLRVIDEIKSMFTASYRSINADFKYELSPPSPPLPPVFLKQRRKQNIRFFVVNEKQKKMNVFAAS